MKRTGRPGLRTTRPVAQLKQGRTGWYEITNQASGDSAEIRIYDEIGWFGTTADDFVREISDLRVSEINLRLNTPGGDAFDGITIYNALRAHGATINVYVDGLAASAGSVIAMAGTHVTMRRATQMMIHNAFGLSVGDADDMRGMADLLDKLSDDIASVYVAKAGGTVAEWRDRMHAETWYSGPEAVAAGLADACEDTPGDVANSWDLSIFNYAGRDAAPPPAPIESLIRDASDEQVTDQEVIDFGAVFRESMSEWSSK